MYVCLCISRQHPGAVRSVLFSPSGYRLYTSYSAGTLAMFDSEQQSCPLLRLLGNAVVRGEEFGPQALAISEDGQRLAYVGPLQCTVTVLDALSLNEARLFFIHNLFQLLVWHGIGIITFVFSHLIILPAGSAIGHHSDGPSP